MIGISGAIFLTCTCLAFILAIWDAPKWANKLALTSMIISAAFWWWCIATWMP